jgi:hypothetical protein
VVDARSFDELGERIDQNRGRHLITLYDGDVSFCDGFALESTERIATQSKTRS